MELLTRLGMVAVALAVACIAMALLGRDEPRWDQDGPNCDEDR